MKITGFASVAPALEPHPANRDSHHSPPRHTRLVGALAAAWAAALVVAACGGASRNAYQGAIAKQESCCESIGDPAAAADCRGGIHRVERPGDEKEPMNRQTFYCIDEHFVCNSRTGKATQASAQDQLDCINDAEAAGR